MSLSRFTRTLGAILLLGTAAAQAASYQFDYVFGGAGPKVSGGFDATLSGDVYTGLTLEWLRIEQDGLSETLTFADYSLGQFNHVGGDWEVGGTLSAITGDVFGTNLVVSDIDLATGVLADASWYFWIVNDSATPYLSGGMLLRGAFFGVDAADGTFSVGPAPVPEIASTSFLLLGALGGVVLLKRRFGVSAV